MRRAVLLVPFLLCALGIAFSQQASIPASPVKIKIRAALFDRDLNLKPVPRLVVSLTPKLSGSPLTTQTSLDGVAELELPLGAYHLTTDKPAELFGKQYLWDLEITVSKPDQVIELSNDNAKVTDSAAARGAHVDELAEQFKRVRGSVATVWTEDAADDGFLIDPAGLVFTSHFVVEGHKWIAAQFDGGRRVAAEVLVDDETNSVAVLRVSMEPLRDIFVPPLSLDPGALIEGERVFTIDNSIKRGKVMSTGVISKADAKEIVSDVKFTDLASPLFNSSGTVVGYSRIINKEMHIVPLTEVRDDIARAKQRLAAATTPAPSRLLPVVPAGDFPVDSLVSRHETRWEKEIYAFKLGDFDMELLTPVARYQYAQERYTAAMNQRMKQKGGDTTKLEQPEHKYESVLGIWAHPQMKMAFWKSWGDNMATNNQAPSTYRPKSSFARLRLLCGDKEVDPIRPGKVAIGTGSNRFVRVDQNAFYGLYTYTPDVISSACGKVTLEVYSASQPDKPLVKVLEPAQVNRVWQDFEPYRKLQAGAAPATPQ
ncbi:MAG: serine protease [Acidobacteriia bacterium]|nr:serine protease [Terriglobia bacterium]